MTMTTRGTKRKVAPYVHWTQKRGARAKTARAVIARAKTRRHNAGR